MAFTSRLTHDEAHASHVSMGSESSPSHRSRPLRALFVHRDAEAIDACVQELEKAQFTVSSDCVLELAQCAEQPRSKSYDVIISEYLGSHRNGSQVLQLLDQRSGGHPVGSRICDLLGKDIEEPPLSVSVGVAGCPSDAETIGTLLYAADRVSMR